MPGIPVSLCKKYTLNLIIISSLSWAFPLLAAPPFSGTIFVNSDIITAEDTSTFTSLTEAGQGTRNEFDRRADDFVNFQAFLFQASYSDTENIEIQVNTEFSSVAEARIEAERYAFVVGQMPGALKRDLDTVTIHKGDVPFGGGNNNLLIHTDYAVSYITDGILEETIVHELSHTSLDLRYESAAGWLSAQSSDPEFISTYARDNPNREDIAESFLMWLAVRYRSDRIPQSLTDTVESSIPARLSYFDSLFLTMHPVEDSSAGSDGPGFTSSGSVTPNTPLFGSFEAAETVYYRLDLPAAGTLFASTVSDVDTWGYLFNEDGTELLSDNNSGTDDQFLLEFEVDAGTYYIGVGGNSAFVGGDFTLNVTVEFNDSDSSTPDFSSATSVTPNTPAFASLEAGETVYFRLDLPAAGTLFASTVSSMDTFGYLYDDQATALLTDDDGGTENQFLLEHEASAGTYYIGIRTVTNQEAGDFTLNVTVDFEDNEVDGPDFSSAASVSPNTPVFGSFETAETIYYRVDIPAEATLFASTVSEIDTFGTLFDEQGNELLSDNDSGTDDQFLLESEVDPGTYFIGVGANSAFDAGSYTLNVTLEFAPVDRPEAPVPAASRINFVDGVTRDVSMGIGAFSSSGEATFATDFVANDFITILGEVMPDPADIGKNGELFAVVKSVTAGNLSITFLNTDGNFEDWDLTLPGLGAASVAAPLEESHSLTIFEGNLQAGKHNIYLAYQVDGGPLIYTKALKIVVAE